MAGRDAAGRSGSAVPVATAGCHGGAAIRRPVRFLASDGGNSGSGSGSGVGGSTGGCHATASGSASGSGSGSGGAAGRPCRAARRAIRSAARLSTSSTAGRWSAVSWCW